MGIATAQNAKNQQNYKKRMEAAGLERVELWRPQGTRAAFKAEWDMSKTVTDLRKKAHD
jgi:hypothetical protein